MGLDRAGVRGREKGLLSGFDLDCCCRTRSLCVGAFVLSVNINEKERDVRARKIHEEGCVTVQETAYSVLSFKLKRNMTEGWT
jgi:hypothetical protein